MNLEVNVFDYISEEEIKELVKETLVSQLREQIKRETDRLIGNSAYYCAYRILDDLITDDQKSLIQAKTTEIINHLDVHTVFYKKS